MCLVRREHLEKFKKRWLRRTYSGFDWLFCFMAYQHFLGHLMPYQVIFISHTGLMFLTVHAAD